MRGRQGGRLRPRRRSSAPRAALRGGARPARGRRRGRGRGAARSAARTRRSSTMGALSAEELDDALARRGRGRRLARGLPRARGRAPPRVGRPAARPRQVRHRHGAARRARSRGRRRARATRWPATPGWSWPGSGPTSRPPTRTTRASSRSSSTRFAELADRVRERHPDVAAPRRQQRRDAARPRAHFDMVRCGVAIYGLDPFGRDPATTASSRRSSCAPTSPT